MATMHADSDEERHLFQPALSQSLGPKRWALKSRRSTRRRLATIIMGPEHK